MKNPIIAGLACCIVILSILVTGCEEEENRPPRFDLTRAVSIEPDPPYRTGQRLTFTANATDPERDIITYTWTVKNSEGVDVTKRILENTTGASVRFVATVDDVYQVIVVAADPDGAEDQTSTLIKVAHGGENRPPTWESVTVLAGQPVEVGQVVSLVANAYDADGDELAYTWTAKNSENDDVTKEVLQLTTGESVQFVANTEDTYLISVEADDRRDGKSITSLLLKVVKKPNGGAIEIKITSPQNGEAVPHKTLVKGTSIGIPEGKVIWVFVNPHAVGQWWPGEPPSMFLDGTWQALCWIGEGPDKNMGEKFDIGVILVAVDEARKLTEELKAGDVKPRPLFTKIYAQVTVTRK